MQNCYTYLIGWSDLNTYYYGVRYSVKATPDDLWVTYFTSSKFVKSQRNVYGEPDIIQIRKTFGSNPEKAKAWEDKVLARMNVKNSDKWLNRTNNDKLKGFHIHNSWNEGLTKHSCAKLKEIGESISKMMIERYKTTQHPVKGKRYNVKQKKENSFKQLSIKDEFESYDEFSKSVYDKWIENRRTGIYQISKYFGVDEGTIKNALKNQGVSNINTNQSWTKILKRYPNFSFKCYEDFALKCFEEIEKGRKPYSLSKEYGLSYCTIKKAIETGEKLQHNYPSMG